MRVIGILADLPGAAAAFEVGDSDVFTAGKVTRAIDISDLPFVRDGGRDWIDGNALKRWLLTHHPDFVYVQVLGAIKHDVRSVTFRKGGAIGAVRGVLGACEMDYVPISPQTWLKPAGLARATDEEIRRYAVKALPSARNWLLHDRDHNRARALLIAMHGAEKEVKKRILYQIGQGAEP